MKTEDRQTSASSTYQFLSGGGEMGQRIREYDWSRTSLGTIDSWPQSLRTCIRIMLTSRQPIWIGWGKELIKFYNDPYKAIVGGKHPGALGAPASVVWKDIWKDIEPLLKTVMEEDEGTYVESQLLIMERNGYPEETYYTFSYTPIPGDDGGTAGMICANTDDTDRIISERQLKTLIKLGQSLTDTQSNKEIIERTIFAISDNPYDFPFALFYSITGDLAKLEHYTDLGETLAAVPQLIDLNADNDVSYLLREVISQRQFEVFDKLKERIGIMPKGAWEIAPDKAIVLPIMQIGVKEPYGFLVVGINPYRLLDEKYSSFFSLIADQVATSFANVHAIEEERKRAQALAEIDQAKSTFFSNISHEFRTPLTLLLGPIEDALNDPDTIPENRIRLDVAHRNALRMQKLVNTLLEFSRIEAGRLQGNFQEVNICAFTEGIASSFRSAIEKAGMQLVLRCVPIGEKVFVDKDMWEKIVLNLISNAFKYSNGGVINVKIEAVNNIVQLSVSDQGVGIPEDQFDKIFDRFHRVDSAYGRSQEGTGIGLALVKELVKLHGGSIAVKSKLGAGSVFIVEIPAGSAHLPIDNIQKSQSDSPVSSNSRAFVGEAMKWGTNGDTGNANIAPGNDLPDRYKVLIADDNADMRDYMKRLLSDQFNVVTAGNGEQAFETAIAIRPDLILSDVMMPVLDGFGLLKKLRGDTILKNTPFIFLSARAGDEAKVEALDAGADDYMVKPFSAKELSARVDANIRINAARLNAAKELSSFLMQAPVGIIVLSGPEYIVELANNKYLPFVGKQRNEIIDMPFFEVVAANEDTQALLDEIRETGNAVSLIEYKTRVSKDGVHELLHLDTQYQPLLNKAGKVERIMVVVNDVTEQVLARKKVIESEKRFQNLVREASVGIIVLTGQELKVEVVNEAYGQLIGHKADELLGQELFNIIPDSEGVFKPIIENVRTTGESLYLYDQPYTMFSNSERKLGYLNLVYQPYKNEFGAITGVIILCQDVTGTVLAGKMIRESEARFRTLAETLPQLVWMTDKNGLPDYASSRWKEYTGVEPDGANAWNEMVHVDDLANINGAWAESREAGNSYRAEVRLRNKDAKYRWFSVQGEPIKNENGEVVKWIGAFTDIDDQKNIEIKLETLVAERTLALGRSNDDLQQFAHVASHDLKEPVRKIKIFIGRVQEDKETQLSEKSKEFVAKINVATDRMFSMIDGVLTYSTINATDQVIQDVNINDVMVDILTDLEVLIGQKSATITYNDLPNIQGAYILIYQLFYNLIANSLKFSKSDTPAVITLTARQFLDYNTDAVEVVVTDNGIGFEQDEEEQIFNSFSRLNSKDKYEGTGLGLSLCRKIVQRHGGSITAAGQKDKGASFTIVLPVRQSKNYI
ncbi:MAG: ATP-binding protein [Flavipsychrobacter sp.]|nr:ATP-binding protein [Flavipsychrobacter sp.]